MTNLVGCGLGEVLVFEPELLGYWADEQVGDEADNEQAGHDVEDERVGLLTGQLVGYVVVKDSVDYERADDAG